MSDGIGRSAVISADGIYRYELQRVWSALEPSLPFIMLNPSTADAQVDDPTIRRCMSFARREGYGGITVVNLYALRATDPRELIGTIEDPAGPENAGHIGAVMTDAHRQGVPVVCAWGTHGGVRAVRRIHNLAAHTHVRLVCLGVTKGGAPRHPLYVRGDVPLVDWPAS